MKSRFAFGMFAGFALACLFFFFFLYFYPSVFRAQAAKNSPAYDMANSSNPMVEELPAESYDSDPVAKYGQIYAASLVYEGVARIVNMAPIDYMDQTGQRQQDRDVETPAGSPHGYDVMASAYDNAMVRGGSPYSS